MKQLKYDVSTNFELYGYSNFIQFSRKQLTRKAKCDSNGLLIFFHNEIIKRFSVMKRKEVDDRV